VIQAKVSAIQGGFASQYRRWKTASTQDGDEIGQREYLRNGRRSRGHRDVISQGLRPLSMIAIEAQRRSTSSSLVCNTTSPRVSRTLDRDACAHLITHPSFDALFGNSHSQNIILSRKPMQRMLDLLTRQAIGKERNLEKFYDAVRKR